MRQVYQHFTFQDGASTIGDGNTFINNNCSTLRLEIYGTATARTVQFYTVNSNNEKIAIKGSNVSNTNVATSTNGTTSEIWLFDISGFYKIVMVVSAISGGNLTVQGELLI